MARWAARPKSEPPDDAASTGGFSLGLGLSGTRLGSLSNHGDDSDDPTASDPDVEPSSGKCDYCGRGRRCLNPLRIINKIRRFLSKQQRVKGARGRKDRIGVKRQPKFLPFVRHPGAECNHCRNSIYDGFKGMLKSKIKTSMQKEGFANKFKLTVSKWELRQIMRELPDGVSLEEMMGLMEIQLNDYWVPLENDDTGEFGLREEEGESEPAPETKVNVVQSSHLEGRQLVGHFWPIEAYKDRFNEDVP